MKLKLSRHDECVDADDSAARAAVADDANVNAPAAVDVHAPSLLRHQPRDADERAQLTDTGRSEQAHQRRSSSQPQRKS